MRHFFRLSLSTALLSACLSFPAHAAPQEQSIVLAGGCFWGMEAVFEHVKGVSQAVPGYAGGQAATAHYETVSTGKTGHAESVKVTYDPEVISLQQLLNIYFVAAHNPTELNYQTPDHGTQYRSAVFYATPEQKQTTEAVIADITKQHDYNAPLVTTLEPLHAFYPAEGYHQHYAALHPDNPYIATYDVPRVEHVKKEFPELYTDKRS